MSLLLGKRALVCGSTQGIGKAAAALLARDGAEVTLLARDEARLQAARDDLPAAHGQTHRFVVADFASPALAREKVIAHLGAFGPIHVLVNNTGGPPPGPAAEARPEEFLAAFQSHLICNHLLAQAVAPGMRAAGYGRIINIVSTSVRQPLRGLGVSNTIRAAVAGWAKTLSNELAPFGVTVNNVLPGATLTGRLKSLIRAKAEKSGRAEEEVLREMLAEIPAGRLAQPEEIAAAVAFLASPAAGYITGVSLPVDGGRIASI